MYVSLVIVFVREREFICVLRHVWMVFTKDGVEVRAIVVVELRAKFLELKKTHTQTHKLI